MKHLKAISKHKQGLLSEKIAIFELVSSGFVVIYHRYKSKLGEIDIIATKPNKILFIEVKSRIRRIDDYSRIVSEKQKQRIYNSSAEFLSKNKQWSEHNVQYKLFIVEQAQENSSKYISHTLNLF